MLINMANNFLISHFSFHFSFFHFSFLMLLRCPVRIPTIDYVSAALTTAIWKPRYVPLCFLSLSSLRYSSSFFGSQYFQYSLWNFFLSLSFFRISSRFLLGQHKYDWNLRVCTLRNKSLLDGILKIDMSNNSSSQADLTSGLVKEKYLAYIWG